MLLQRIQQKGTEPEIPLHELFRILRPIHPGKIKYKIRVTAVRVQFLRFRINIILINNKTRGLFKPSDPVDTVLAVTYIL